MQIITPREHDKTIEELSSGTHLGESSRVCVNTRSDASDDKCQGTHDDQEQNATRTDLLGYGTKPQSPQRKGNKR